MGGLNWGSLGDWAAAVATIVVAIVAVFQDAIRSWIFAPLLHAAIETAPPDCVWVPLTRADGFSVQSVHARLLISNGGRATAYDVEVYAHALRRLGPNGQWQPVQTFPPMNLIWANAGGIYISGIAPGTGKHCDLGHIADPNARNYIPTETNPALNLGKDDAAFVFALAVIPNHRGNVIGPGSYQLDVILSAKNAPARIATVGLSFDGRWISDETEMMSKHMHLQIVRQGARPVLRRSTPAPGAVVRAR